MTELFPELRTAADAEHIPVVHPDTAEYLFLLIRKIQPHKILEIGSAIGYSAMLMATACSGCMIDTVDLSKPAVLRAQTNIRDRGFSDRIKVLHRAGIDHLRSCQTDYDFIFIDARMDEYPDYFSLSLSHLCHGGSILMDNIGWHGKVFDGKVHPEDARVDILRQFLDELRADKRGKTEIIRCGDGLAFFRIY